MSRKEYILAFSLLAAVALAVALALVLESNSAGARPPPQELEVKLGKPAYGGPGCPQGSVNAVLSPDRRKLTIVFDRYVAQTSRGDPFDRKSCNLGVPLEVPPGLSVALLQLDYRGFVKLPRGAKGTFRAEYFFAGTQGPALEQAFSGEIEDDYLITDRVPATVLSACGRDTIARVNSSIRVEKRSALGPDAIMTVDSTDVTAEGIIFYLDIRRC